MKIKYKFVLSVIIFIVLLAVIYFIVWIPNRTTLIFVPDIFLTEYLKVLGEVIPIIFGFILLNYFWNRRYLDENYDFLKNIINELLSQLSQASYYLGETETIEPSSKDEYINKKRMSIYFKNQIISNYEDLRRIVKEQLIHFDSRLFYKVNQYLIDTEEHIKKIREFSFEISNPDEDFYLSNSIIGQNTVEVFNFLEQFVIG